MEGEAEAEGGAEGEEEVWEVGMTGRGRGEEGTLLNMVGGGEGVGRMGWGAGGWEGRRRGRGEGGGEGRSRTDGRVMGS